MRKPPRQPFPCPSKRPPRARCPFHASTARGRIGPAGSWHGSGTVPMQLGGCCGGVALLLSGCFAPFCYSTLEGQEASPRPRLSVPTNTAREVTSREIPVPIFRGQLGPRQSSARTPSALAALQLRAARLLLTPSRPCRAAALAHPYTHPAHTLHTHTCTHRHQVYLAGSTGGSADRQHRWAPCSLPTPQPPERPGHRPPSGEVGFVWELPGLCHLHRVFGWKSANLW